MKKAHDITGGSDRPGGLPFQFQQQHGLIFHPACPTEDRFDRGVNRFDGTKADLVIAVSGDAL